MRLKTHDLGIVVRHEYDYMDPRLVRLFEKLVPPHLGMRFDRDKNDII